jgi:hypothetical protein
MLNPRIRVILAERDVHEDLSLDVRIILKLILKIVSTRK